MEVDLKKLKEALAYRAAVNKAELMDLVIIDGDKRTKVSDLPEEDLDAFKCTGLNNIDFLRVYFLGSDHITVIKVWDKRLEEEDA